MARLEAPSIANRDPTVLRRMAPSGVSIQMKTTSSLILFDAGHDELFSLQTGYKNLGRRLKNDWRLEIVKSPISDTTLMDVKIFVIAAPRSKFTQAEIDNLRNFVKSGGSLLIFATEESQNGVSELTNINYLLEEYGISSNLDSVLRTTFFKYYHPKEALVSNGLLNRGILPTSTRILDNADTKSLIYVYPFGCTLNVSKPSVPIMSTGTVCFPLNRPTTAFYIPKQATEGRITVVGSAHMFHDQYLDKEENAKILDAIIQFLSGDHNFPLSKVDADNPEISDYVFTPDIILLAEQMKVCLHETEGDFSDHQDFTATLDSTLYDIDLGSLPSIIKGYSHLNVKHEPLSLITPQFETPMPPLKPATFPPIFLDLDMPSLELYDLDETFSSEKIRLARLMNSFPRQLPIQIKPTI
uniref:ABC-type uncharacterized transport system domain-containing protein n=1 Tax=Romanomermis culicivorax TaxID=13658 RepID=A0A915KTX7_ROMCU